MDDLNKTLFDLQAPYSLTPPKSDGFTQLMVFLDNNLKPFLICVGFVLNVYLQVLVFSSKLHKLPPLVYLAALSFIDSVYLCITLLVWIEKYFHVNISFRRGVCQYLSYLTYLLQFSAAWLLFALALDRFLAVCHPDRVEMLCTAFRAKLFVASLLVIGVYSHAYITYFWAADFSVKYGIPTCNLAKEYESAVIILLKISSVVSFILPYCASILMAVFILKRLCDRYIQLDRNEPSSGAGSVTVHVRNASSQEPPTRPLRVNIIFLVLLLITLVLRVPSRSMETISFFTDDRPPIPRAWGLVIGMLFHLWLSLKCLTSLILSPRIRYEAKCMAIKCVHSLCNCGRFRLRRRNTEPVELSLESIPNTTENEESLTAIL